MDITIDGQTIKLTPAQAAQFKKAVLKETEVPAPMPCGNFRLSCKKAGKAAQFPLVIATRKCYPTPDGWGAGDDACGGDYSLAELKGFIINLKTYAAKIWSTAPALLKNV